MKRRNFLKYVGIGAPALAAVGLAANAPPEWDNDDGVYDPALGELANKITNVTPISTPFMQVTAFSSDFGSLEIISGPHKWGRK